MQAIAEREADRVGIEQQLEAASQRQDVEAITQLGLENEQTKERLNQTWAEWDG